MTNAEIYVSVDVESDGPLPGPNSMLSLGAAAYKEDGTRYSTFTVNFGLLPGASGDPNTMEWWSRQPQAWAEARRDPVPPARAIEDFVLWVQGLPGTPVFVAYPAGYDFLFVYWYMMYFLKRSPFSFSALDMKTFAMATLGVRYKNATKKNFPARWKPKTVKHTHVALEDAIEQGEIFMNMLAESKRQKTP